jgi:hypothetical protein
VGEGRRCRVCVQNQAGKTSSACTALDRSQLGHRAQLWASHPEGDTITLENV